MTTPRVIDTIFFANILAYFATMSVIKTTSFVSDTITLLFHTLAYFAPQSVITATRVSNTDILFFTNTLAYFATTSMTYTTEVVPDTDVLVVDTKTLAYCLYVSVKDCKKGFRH